MKTTLCIGFVLLCFLGLAGCSKFVTEADDALEQAEKATEITGALPAPYVSYVSSALTGLECAATEAGTSDSPGLMASKIVQCLTSAAIPVLPAGTAVNVVTAAQSVNAAIQSLLSEVPKTGVVRVAVNSKPAKFKFSSGQKKKLAVYAARAHADRTNFLATHPVQ